MTRRSILGFLFLSLLSGCGFELRGTSGYAAKLENLYVEGVQPGTPLMQRINEILRRADVKLAKDRHGASAVLRVLDIDEDTRTLSVSGAGRSTEFDLTYKLAFELTTAKGEIILPRQEIRIDREYFNDQFLAIGRAQEEVQLRQEMQMEAAETMARRVAWKLGQRED
ncbi:MAG TPA: LPS assembly lipoprotein LptE [Methylococcaceae bacterium]|nr:LPS assembly lipoprotein LptE [Methylococcaceae bacterium]